MKSSAAGSRVSADGHGVVSHAGTGLLREVADLTGLSAQVTAALADTYRGPWIYEPGAVFADLAAAVADGADCIDGVGQSSGDREHVFGAAASTTTMWRLVDARVDAAHLPGIRAARAHARAAAWAAGAAPAEGQWLHLDVDATITIDHSDNKQDAAATWKKTWGHHPLLVFLDRPEIAGGEALAGLLRPGNAGLILRDLELARDLEPFHRSNQSTADHEPLSIRLAPGRWTTAPHREPRASAVNQRRLTAAPLSE